MKQQPRGRIRLTGTFRVGEGNYHVRWKIHDTNMRSCSGSWEFTARIGSKRFWGQGTSGGVIAPVLSDPFAPEPFIAKPRDRGGLSVKIIVNLNPPLVKSADLPPMDLDGLAGILRLMNRESRFGYYSLVVCSIEAQRVFYRQDLAPEIDLAALAWL